MAKCKACGADIIWIKTASGKNMPVNAQKIPYKRDFTNGKLNLVCPDGRVVKADLDLESDEYGHESHFATCPAATMFRKIGK